MGGFGISQFWGVLAHSQMCFGICVNTNVGGEFVLQTSGEIVLRNKKVYFCEKMYFLFPKAIWFYKNGGIFIKGAI